MSVNKASGFTLIELAIVILIVGVVTVAGIRIATPLMEASKRIETKEKLKKIEEALAEFAVLNYRVPCPAEPIKTTSNPVTNGYGLEKNNGYAVPHVNSRCGVDTATAWRGIVPFKTLGIPEDYTRDAWGNLFTYAVSPAFALPPVAAKSSVHASCRTREWMYMSTLTPTPAYKSINPDKAGFCCAGAAFLDHAQNLLIKDSANQALPYRNRVRAMSGDEVDQVDEPYKSFSEYVPLDQTPMGVVYVLVSHGPNGAGTAYNNTSYTRSFIPSSMSSICEYANAIETSETGSRTYRDCLLAEDVAINNNDDMVVWRTQEMIFAAEGQSCAVP